MSMWRRKKDAEGAPALGPEFDTRIDAILDDVREEADRILAEARRKAAGATTEIDEALAYRRLRLLELYETLIARAELVLARLDDVELGRESLGRMLRAVSQAADELSHEVAAGSAPDGPAARDEDRQRAIEMAAAGATRGEVEAQLRELSGQPDDPAAILDQVFGPASARDSRVPWAVASADRPAVEPD